MNSITKAPLYHHCTIQFISNASAAAAAAVPAGNVNTQPTSWLARVLYTGKDCYLAETNIHY
jgi:hypothetical protein